MNRQLKAQVFPVRTGFQRCMDTMLDVVAMIFVIIVCTFYLGHVIQTSLAANKATTQRMYDAMITQQKMDIERSRELSSRIQSFDERLKLLSDRLESDSMATEELKSRVQLKGPKKPSLLRQEFDKPQSQPKQ